MSVRARVDFTTSDDPRVAVFVGMMAPVRRVTFDERARMVAAEAMRVAGGSVPLAAAPTLEDVCPDPLVYAIECGLPRIRVLDQQIDGGSVWRNYSRIPVEEQFFAVSHIRAVEERRTSTGRLMMRASYATTFSTRRGVLIGTAVGYSLDVEVSS
jgi:hypothetical protein